jgi:hypothetical protein
LKLLARIIRVAAVVAASLLAQPALAASDRPAPPPPAAGPRDLPVGASEAEVRLYCTRKYDEEVSLIADKAGGAGGMLVGPATEEWRRCLRRNGVAP